MNSDSFRATFVAGNRDVLLHALYFLVKDLSTHKKRAYLAPFLSTIEIPVEFQQDDGMYFSFSSFSTDIVS